MDLSILVLVFDLCAALFEAYVHWRVAVNDGEAIAPAIPTQRQVTSGLGPGIKMLVKPLVWRNHNASRLPVRPNHLAVLGPKQRIALPAEDGHVGPGAVAMGLFISADGKFRDMSAHDVAGKIEVDVFPACAPFFPVVELKVPRVRNEIDRHLASPELPFAAEILIVLGQKAVGKGEIVVENEIEVMKDIHHERRVGHSKKT